jgi:hypothetical protein
MCGVDVNGVGCGEFVIWHQLSFAGKSRHGAFELPATSKIDVEAKILSYLLRAILVLVYHTIKLEYNDINTTLLVYSSLVSTKGTWKVMLSSPLSNTSRT